VVPRSQELPPDVSGLLVAAQELLASFGGPDPLTQACRITRDVLDADLVVAFVTPDDGVTLRSEAQYGLDDETWAAYQVIQLPDEIASRIRDRLQATDVSVIDGNAPGVSPADEERRAIALKLGLGPILLLALRTGGALTGVMIACRDAHRVPFDDTAVQVATAFGPLLGASLENQRLLQALEAAHQAQTEFLASMSHELRTPLNVITGYLDMLLDGLAGQLEQPQREICERIRRSASQQLSLVGEAFEISRRDADGVIPARREEISVPALVADLEREATLRAVAPAVAVEWTVHDLDMQIVSDPVKLRMIVRNLVDNAIKFTERGHVRIDVSLEDEVLVWRVRDTGLGIPEVERDAIFEAFRQVGGCSTGLGLGLHIVRRLTDALDGTVEVASVVGEGSTFTVRVPVEVLPAADEATTSGA
jgi:signal transduction histidine kinase